MLRPSPQLARLRHEIGALGSVVVCFSGGIDSALVLAIAQEQLGAHAVALTAVSPSLPPAERLEAAALAEALGATHILRSSNELKRPGYVQNGPDRCYHCKSELYTLAEEERVRLGFAHIANGTNLDDLGDYRPGLKAADEALVRSPLVSAEFRKADVRTVAQELGLEIWSKPAAACLASRVPYGTEVTASRLRQIGTFEAALKQLGLSQVRVRWHDTVARIEVPLGELPRLCELNAEVVRLGRANGFQYVAADLAGYRQGSLNELLDDRRLRVLP